MGGEHHHHAAEALPLLVTEASARADGVGGGKERSSTTKRVLGGVVAAILVVAGAALAVSSASGNGGGGGIFSGSHAVHGAIHVASLGAGKDMSAYGVLDPDSPLMKLAMSDEEEASSKDGSDGDDGKKSKKRRVVEEPESVPGADEDLPETEVIAEGDGGDVDTSAADAMAAALTSDEETGAKVEDNKGAMVAEDDEQPTISAGKDEDKFGKRNLIACRVSVSFPTFSFAPARVPLVSLVPSLVPSLVRVSRNLSFALARALKSTAAPACVVNGGHCARGGVWRLTLTPPAPTWPPRAAPPAPATASPATATWACRRRRSRGRRGRRGRGRMRGLRTLPT